MQSSTQAIPESAAVPRHIAIIMDGNGRWAKRRFLPRVAGHKRGVDAVRDTVSYCKALGVEYLTLFAFSSENWRRPQEEVSFLMGLFLQVLEREVARMADNNIRLQIIGAREHFPASLQERIAAAEANTAHNTGLTLTVAADYGGRWDILNAFNHLIANGHPPATPVTEADLRPYLALGDAPEPDLFIRTGGEQRISNFLLWQLAYTELFFTETLWPDFKKETLDAAIASFQARERRFGRTSEQLMPSQRRTD